jgi:hypothetical protein
LLKYQVANLQNFLYSHFPMKVAASLSLIDHLSLGVQSVRFPRVLGARELMISANPHKVVSFRFRHLT